MGFFAEYAPAYADAGLVVFPVGGDDGKTPLVAHWNRFGRNSHARLVEKFPDTNIGLLDGIGVCRVDIDDPAYVDHCIDRFGYTPIKTETPSGVHLWYKANGESRQIRPDGLPFDILGRGGFGVAPPSTRPDGAEYRFLEGSLRDVPRLPTMRALQTRVETALKTDAPRGTRNRFLFRALREIADALNSESELQAVAHSLNSGISEPLSPAEVKKTVGSVWKYKVEGRIIKKGEAAAVMRVGELGLPAGPFKLLADLRLKHAARQSPIALPKMAAKAYGLSPDTLVKYRSVLVEWGYLTPITEDVKNCPNRYWFNTRGRGGECLLYQD